MKRTEQLIHQAVVSHLNQRGVDGLLYWHTPNGARMGGKRGLIQGAIAKSMGVRAGVSDILAFHGGKLYALELKAPKEKPTDAQASFLARVKINGGEVAVAQGLDQALGALEGWGLLKGRA